MSLTPIRLAHEDKGAKWVLASSSCTYVVSLTWWGRLCVLFGWPVIVAVHTEVARDGEATTTTVTVGIHA